ncbi:unnamed protein product [Meganyctiphanes norvegica]|uniref:Uncharacterized protein n=1 Tax=Meganyctiphanes norvegica TaxID=48144 RepID=A0AAV2RA24_MEGNR
MSSESDAEEFYDAFDITPHRLTARSQDVKRSPLGSGPLGTETVGTSSPCASEPPTSHPGLSHLGTSLDIPSVAPAATPSTHPPLTHFSSSPNLYGVGALPHYGPYQAAAIAAAVAAGHYPFSPQLPPQPANASASHTATPHYSQHPQFDPNAASTPMYQHPQHPALPMYQLPPQFAQPQPVVGGATPYDATQGFPSQFQLGQHQQLPHTQFTPQQLAAMQQFSQINASTSHTGATPLSNSQFTVASTLASQFSGPTSTYSTHFPQPNPTLFSQAQNLPSQFSPPISTVSSQYPPGSNNIQPIHPSTASAAVVPAIVGPIITHQFGVQPVVGPPLPTTQPFIQPLNSMQVSSDVKTLESNKTESTADTKEKNDLHLNVSSAVSSSSAVLGKDEDTISGRSGSLLGNLGDDDEEDKETSSRRGFVGGRRRTRHREVRKNLQREDDDIPLQHNSPGGSQSSSIEGMYPGRTSHPFRVVEHDTASIYSSLSLGKVGKILGGMEVDDHS